MEKKSVSPNGLGLSLEKTLIQWENMSTHGIVWIIIELSFQPGEIAGEYDQEELTAHCLGRSC